MLLKPFVINSHGSIVFPGNFFPELDFSVFKTLKQLQQLFGATSGRKRRRTSRLRRACRRVNTRTVMTFAVTWY